MAAELRVFIVDDEPPAVERLTEMLSSLSCSRVIGCESRAERVLERCRVLSPDVVLLDIEMPGQGGLALAARLAEMSPAPDVIFVTAHDEFALEAFGVAARDYLVKPVRRERLAQALDRLRDRSQEPPVLIAARIGERRIRIPLGEIRAFTAEDKCTLVHSVGGTAVVDDPLKTLESRFGDRFLRVHRNALVSRQHVRGLSVPPTAPARVELADVEIRPEISRRNRAIVRSLVTGAPPDEESRTHGEH